MQQLALRLLALDPDVAETFRVVAYFDTLVAGQAGPEALLRGAAILSGCAVGFETSEATMRVDSEGVRTDPVTAERGGGSSWIVSPLDRPGRVWLERQGEPHSNDAMIVERLSIALAATLGRVGLVAEARHALEVLIDARSSAEERAAAAGRMRLSPAAEGRIVAQPADVAATGAAASVIVPTRVGFLRAVYLPQADARRDLAGRAGVGTAAHPSALDASWRAAVVALRLSTASEPVVVADDLGALLPLLEEADGPGSRHPDLARIAELVAHDASTVATLEVLVRVDSIRAAAAVLGLHHSSVRSRVAGISRSLGYDVRTPEARVRLTVALRLHRLATTRFDGQAAALGAAMS